MKKRVTLGPAALNTPSAPRQRRYDLTLASKRAVLHDLQAGTVTRKQVMERYGVTASFYRDWTKTISKVDQTSVLAGLEGAAKENRLRTAHSGRKPAFPDVDEVIVAYLNQYQGIIYKLTYNTAFT